MTYVNAELRRLIIERSGNCCEYCLLSQEDYPFTFHIEHVIAEKHGGLTIIVNLCLSCPLCNTHKGSDIGSLDPQSGILIPLFNPRKQTWTDHFQLSEAVIEPLTPEGRVTVFLLRLNEPDRVSERQGLIELNRYPCIKS